MMLESYFELIVLVCVFMQAAAKAAQQAGQLDQQVAELQAQQMQMLHFNEVRGALCHF